MVPPLGYIYIYSMLLAAYPADILMKEHIEMTILYHSAGDQNTRSVYPHLAVTLYLQRRFFFYHLQDKRIIKANLQQGK